MSFFSLFFDAEYKYQPLMNTALTLFFDADPTWPLLKAVADDGDIASVTVP